MAENSYRRVSEADYSHVELLQLLQPGKGQKNEKNAVFAGTVFNSEREYIYIMYYPVDVSGITMYVNGNRFASGKKVIIPICLLLVLLVLAAGILYGYFTTKAIRRLMMSVQEIASRGYFPIQEQGVF